MRSLPNGTTHARPSSGRTLRQASRSRTISPVEAGCDRAIRSGLRTPRHDAERRRRLNERLRAEWLAGAEEEWRKRTGRPMTAEELERVLRRYPGDL